MREPVNDFVHVARVFAHDGDAVGGLIDGDGNAVAVENLAACRGQEADVDAVLFGEKAILIGLIDLKMSHAQAKHGHKSDLRAAEQKRAAGRGGGGFLRCRQQDVSCLPREGVVVTGLRFAQAKKQLRGKHHDRVGKNVCDQPHEREARRGLVQ